MHLLHKQMFFITHKKDERKINMNYKINLGNKIHNLRIKKRYSVEDVKNIFSTYEYPISKKSIYRWESNEVTPDLSAINIICDVFGIPVTELLDIKCKDDVKVISKYEKEFLIALRTNHFFKKIMHNIIKKEENDVTHWKKIEDFKERI